MDEIGAVFSHSVDIKYLRVYIFRQNKSSLKNWFSHHFHFSVHFFPSFFLSLSPSKRGTNLMHVIQIKRRSIRITLLDYFLEKSPTSKLYKNSILSSTQFLFSHIPCSCNNALFHWRSFTSGKVLCKRVFVINMNRRESERKKRRKYFHSPYVFACVLLTIWISRKFMALAKRSHFH